MATKTFSGQLDQAIEGAASGNKLLFVPQENLGEVLMGAASEMVVGDDGTYSITLAYNTYSVYHYSDVTKCKILIADGVEVSASTSVSTIPDLIGVSVPVTDSDVLTNQGYLQEGQDYASSAKNSANASASLYNNFNKKIGQAIEPIETGVPMLDVPFNDSGILKKGVGTEYVSGLPVYGVDFTRSTASTVINKSGALEALAADEIGVGDDGVYLHGAYTNLITYSQDFTQWTSVTTADASTQASDFWNDNETLLTVNATASTRAVRRKSSTFSGGITSYTYYAIVKQGTAQSVYLGVANGVLLNAGCSANVKFDFSAESLTVGEPSSADISSGFSRLKDDYYLIWFSIYNCSGVSAGANNLDIGIESDTEGETAIFVLSQCVENLTGTLPYIPTDSSTSSVTAASCSLPVDGNIPPSGTCTIVGDFNPVGELSTTNSWLFDTSSSDTLGYFFRVNYDRTVIAFGALGNVFSSSYSTQQNKEYRVVMVSDYDALTLDVYIDGELVANNEISDPLDQDVGSNITFGSWYNGAQQTPVKIKNFKVLPYAASADEVKSWGAPK